LGQLYVQGVQPCWQEVLPAGRLIQLPTYPWQREHFWLPDLDNPSPSKAQVASNSRRSQFLPGQVFLGEYLEMATQSGTCYWEKTLSVKDLPYLRDHQLQGMTVMPGAAYVEIALEVAQSVLSPGIHEVRQVKLHNLLVLDEEKEYRLQVVCTSSLPDEAEFQIFSSPVESDQQAEAQISKKTWALHANGSIQRVQKERAVSSADGSWSDLRERGTATISGEELYRLLVGHGISYGPAFRDIDRLWYQPGEALARVHLSSDIQKHLTDYHIHPALLDTCFQVIAMGLPRDEAAGKPESVYLPMKVGSCTLFDVQALQGQDEAFWASARVHPGSDGVDTWVGDVTLRNQQGNVILEVEQLHLQNLETVSAPDRKDELADWFYELEWEEIALPEALPVVGQAQKWLIFADRQGVGEQLGELLRDRGDEVILVRQAAGFAVVSSQEYKAGPQQDAFIQVFREAWRQESGSRHIVYLWGMETHLLAADEASAVEGQVEQVSISLLWLVQALAQMGWRDMPRLWLCTQGAQVRERSGGALDPVQTTIWGLGRVIMHEQPRWMCSLVDLRIAPGQEDIHKLVQLMSANLEESQCLIQDGQVYAARLVQSQFPPLTSLHQPQKCAGDVPFRLHMESPGILEHLVWQEMVRQLPGPGEVEVEVKAVSLNFVDILQAMGIYPGQEPGVIKLGRECTGFVTRVGEGVTRFTVGDEVIVMLPDCFATHVIIDTKFLISKPSFMSFEEAASIPSAFLTSYYALCFLGHLAQGERVLIHSASGGTGLAAIQIAKMRGAEIFATAGSHEKREFLRSLGIQHVMDSRLLSFAEEILEITHGEGVDVVLNSLTGEAMARSLSILAPYGRFLEIGKKDIYQQGHLDLSPFKKGLSY
ncbi:MAG: polyketide synthase dehydratase domain-containing protein, partial [Ktedonobacteraceae bacterium]|nr:polyketide synthase dehydratase domain-containing protein [Ktedonobacteraceae bacterium]